MTTWEPFTRQRVTGVYWVSGFCPETDGDVDADGRPIGWHTGKSLPFVSLVWLHVDDEGVIMAYPIGHHEIGNFEDEYFITHIMELNIPEHPERGAA
jgi:hypothetical protein